MGSTQVAKSKWTWPYIYIYIYIYLIATLDKPLECKKPRFILGYITHQIQSSSTHTHAPVLFFYCGGSSGVRFPGPTHPSYNTLEKEHQPGATGLTTLAL